MSVANCVFLNLAMKHPPPAAKNVPVLLSKTRHLENVGACPNEIRPADR
jgi:hypothetical protein